MFISYLYPFFCLNLAGHLPSMYLCVVISSCTLMRKAVWLTRKWRIIGTCWMFKKVRAVFATCLILYSKISNHLLTNLVNPCTSLFESFCQPVSLGIFKSINDSFKNWVFYVPLDGTVINYKSGRGLAQAVILGGNFRVPAGMSIIRPRLFEGFKISPGKCCLQLSITARSFHSNSFQLNKL